jgi:hypothetical protein
MTNLQFTVLEVPLKLSANLTLNSLVPSCMRSRRLAMSVAGLRLGSS